MKRSEVLEIVKQALDAIHIYRMQDMSKTAGILEKSLNEQIEKSIRDLVKEAYMLGPSGSICPRCGGSGKV